MLMSEVCKNTEPERKLKVPLSFYLFRWPVQSKQVKEHQKYPRLGDFH